MKHLKNFNESIQSIPDVTPLQISVMEREMGEWVIDVCDISLQLNDYKDYNGKLAEPQMKQPMEKMFQEKYSDVWYDFIKQKSDKYPYNDITEYINNMKGDKISENEYYQMCADIYNLHPAFKKFFHATWLEYNLDN